MSKFKNVLIGIGIGVICEIVLCSLVSVVLFSPRKLSFYSPIKADEIVEIQVNVSYMNNGYMDSKVVIITDCNDLARDILNLKVKPKYLDYLISDESCINSVTMYTENDKCISIYDDCINSGTFSTYRFHYKEEIFNLVINYLEKNNIEY